MLRWTRSGILRPRPSPWLAAGLLLLASPAHAQVFEIGNAQVSTCTGAFLDSGGQGASGYSNNEDYTCTICPDEPGAAISVNFITAQFSTGGAAPVDNMTVYDGNSTAAPVLGNWTGTALEGQVVSATDGNTSGCLTFVWHSNNTGTGVFAGSITCYVPCARPTAAAVMSEAAPALICPGESVTFNGGASTAAAGFNITSWSWVWGDGTSTTANASNASHTFADPGGYTVQLYVTDNNGCSSVNLVDLDVLVGTTPDFNGTGGTLTGCTGQELCLTGQVNAQTWNELPDVNLGDGVELPDNVGECFTSELTFGQFPPGSTLTNVNQLGQICLNMEHSFMGDLIVRIIGPTGQTVVMHQQNGGGTYLGVPNDFDEGNPQLGTCWTYCFSPTATNGTWVDNAGGTLPAGTYESLNPLAGLVGSPLNGTWTIQICDMWSIDNGFLCDWSIDFDPSLYDDLIQFTPVYGTGCDSTWWTGPGITGTANNCEGMCVSSSTPGTFAYTYHAVDNHGCAYDTTLTVTVLDGPQAGTDGAMTVCANGTPIDLLTLLGGADPGGTWTAPGGGATGAVFTPGTSTPGSYTYTVTGTAPCPNDQAVVTVAQNVPVNAGTDGAVTLCADGATVDLSTILAEGQPGGTWTDPDGGPSTSIYTPGTSAPGTYTYTVAGPAPCPDDAATVTVTQNDPVDAGTDGTITVCSDGATVDLFTLLGGADEGGAWTDPGGNAGSAIYAPGSNAPGTYTYTVTGLAPCVDDQATVTVTQNDPVNAGTDGTVTVCSDGPAIDIFALLGDPDAGGAWTDPGNNATSATYIPGSSTPGTYTYTLTALAPCADDQATVTVTQNDPVNAGTDDAITVCADGAALDLFALLDAPDADGSWTDPGGGAASATYTPGTSSPGIYTYTVTALAPCLDDQATVTVTQNDPVDAGTDGTITVCSNGVTVDLFALLGAPDAGGNWTDPGGGIVSSTYAPGTSAPGTYTYAVTALAPCLDDQATVTVTQNDPVDSGTDGTITVCSDGAPVDLFALLGAPDAGGSWTDPGGGTVSSTYAPGTSAPGTYTYTVTALAPCVDDQATVTVTQNDPVNAGTDGATTVCADGAALDLFALLGAADAGGAWTDPGNNAAPATYTPGTSSPGTYMYTVTALSPCADDQATVTVTQNDPVNSGTDGAITVCADGSTVDLFALLGGPDAGGAWTDPGGGASSGTYTPGTSTPGTYTYTVTALAPCADDQSVVTIIQNDPVNAGTDGAVTLCVSSPPTGLFAALGGAPDAGGTWTAPGGGAFNGTFTPGTDAPGIYTYSLDALAPCSGASATVTVAVVSLPDPGTDGSVTLCASGAALDLFSVLGGSPDAGGTWAAPGGAAHTGSVDPSVDVAGVYTYTIDVPPPCVSVSASVTLTLQTPPDAGQNGAELLCVTSTATDLFAALQGTPDAGGAWAAPGGGASDGVFTPGTSAPGVYIYTVPGTAPCPAANATVDVTVTSIPDAGTPGNVTLCTSGAQQDLFGALGGTPDNGGAWTTPGGSTHSGSLDPAVDAAGVYTYTINAPPPCPSVSSTVTVALNAPPDPGQNGSALLCVTSPATDLVLSLQGTPEAGGTWTTPDGTPFSGSFTPGTDAPGTYTYTVPGNAPCPAASAIVEVTVIDIPDAGTPGNVTLCTSGAVQDLFAVLGGTPDGGGAWTAPGGGAHSGSLDPAADVPGPYAYTINAPLPCPSVSSTVTVVLNAPPDPGQDGSVLLCVSSPTTDLFASLQGTPNAGGTWSAPGGETFNGIFLPGTSDPGTYTYTVAGTAPCPAASATVDVQVITYPDPGTNGQLTLCAVDAPADLFAALGGNPDSGGGWTTPDGSAHDGLYDPAADAAGIYTYTIAVPAPCSSVSATVTVAVQQPPSAGSGGALSLCISGMATALSGGLNGTPDGGGVWSDPVGNATDATFVPGTDTPGDYTYTVTGLAPCPNTSAIVSVTVNNEPDAGLNGAIVLCAGGQGTDLFSNIGGTPDTGGTWSDPDGNAHSGNYDPALDAAGVYTYTITVPPPCSSASSTVTVVVENGPDPGTDGSITLCVTDAPLLLFPALGGTPDANGVWTTPSGDPSDGTFNPSAGEPGTYTYTLAGTPPCQMVFSTVEVAVHTPADAGANGAVTICSSDGPQGLFAQLTGTPGAGGTWTAPDGGAHTGMLDPATDGSGVYTYNLTSSAPCPGDAAVVLVTIIAPPDAGTEAPLSLCSNGAATVLIGVLGGTPDANGTWTAPDGSAFTGSLDPGIDAPGTYTYTVTGTAPCPDAVAVIDVAITAAPDAGSNGAILLCSASPSTDLFSHLNGTPDTGGAWSAPGGGTSDGSFDPATGTPGSYTYTVSGTAPCVDASTTVLVNVSSDPDAGLPGEAVLCSTGANVDLLGLLGGTPDAGGAWTGPDGAPHTGLLDPEADPPGTYSYLIAVPPPCTSASSSVTIAFTAPADPGADGAAVHCATDAPIDLFAQLGGTPDAGGSWSLDGQPEDNVFDPAVDAPGTYLYTVISNAPCPAMSAAVAMTVHTPPDPGTDGAAALCASGAPVLLSGLLGGSPQAGGTWTFQGAPHSGLLDPASGQSGIYTYTVQGIEPCPAEQAIVEVTIALEPDPGTNGLATVCMSGSTIDLFAELGGTPDAGGAWSGPSTVVGGLFDPATMQAGDYIYFIDVPPPCTSAGSTVTVVAIAPPVPGTDGDLLLCASSSATGLIGALGGAPQPGGAWTAPDGSPHGPLFNPASDAQGDYVYTVNGTSPCPAAQATVTMTVVSSPDPGGNGFLTQCWTDAPEDLFERLEGTPNPGGTWSGPSPCPDGFFHASTMLPGTYFYLLNAPAPCPDASSNVLVSVSLPPDPGADGALTLCTTAEAMDLFGLLNGTPQNGGTWTAPGGAPHAGAFLPGQDPAGTYTYNVPGNAPCPAAWATVTMALNTPPDAGLDGSLTLCPEADAADLFAQLGGAQGGGSWSAPGGGSSNGVFDPATGIPGTYTYTVQGMAPCTDDAAVVVVAVNPAVAATASATDAVCHDACDGTAVLTMLSGTPGYTMQWSGGVAGSAAMEANGLCAGAYTILITDANGCTGSTAYTVDEPLPLVIDAIGTGDENCIGSCDGYVNVVDSEGVLFSVDGGATWSEGNVLGGLCAGGYTVLMQDANGCLASAPATIASPPPVTAGFTPVPDTMNVTGTTVTFLNQSGNATQFVWDFGGAGTSTEGEPAFTFPDVLGGVYTVCLTAMDANGCVDSTCLPVVILDELLISVPNAFTPNGDGINEVFLPVLNMPASGEDYTFMVFDRWGLLLFSTERPGHGWDGEHGGQPVPNDVYVWKLRCRDRVTGKAYDPIGHVTVVR